MPADATLATTPPGGEYVLAGSTPVPFDRASDPDGPALDSLSADLAAAGRRARNRKVQANHARADPAFSEALRGRLLEPIGARVGGSLLGAPGRAVSFGNQARRAGAVALAPDSPTGPLNRPRPGVRAGSTVRRTSSPRTWAILGIGVIVLAVAAAGFATGRFTPTPGNRVGEAADATLIRSGGSQPLVAGTALLIGDEIRVAAGGHATLILGSSQTRLAGGADVRLNVLAGPAVQLALLAGRAYHRVVEPAGDSYAVVTGPYTWTASGTAFDLNRTPAPGGGEEVTLLALEHAIAIDGPDTHMQVAEGSSATVMFGNPASAGVTVGPIPTSVFSDPWLIKNAKTDESLGYPIGALAGVALAPNDTPSTSPSPSPSPTESPADSPSVSPSDSPSPTPGQTPTPTPTPTPGTSPSPSPSPTPTATPQPTFGLALTSCPGGVVLNWSKYSGTGFVRYVTLRNSSPTIPRAYPPQAGSIVLAGAGTTVLARTSAADATVSNGFTYWYRTLALGSGGAVLAASAIESGLGYGQANLGFLSLNGTVLSWPYYRGNLACFSEYRLLYSSNPDPTPANSSAVTWKPATPQTGSNVQIPAAASWNQGQTIYFRVEVLRVTALGSFVVAQTSNIQLYAYP
jgi:hypothetical protein